MDIHRAILEGLVDELNERLESPLKSSIVTNGPVVGLTVDWDRYHVVSAKPHEDYLIITEGPAWQKFCRFRFESSKLYYYDVSFVDDVCRQILAMCQVVQRAINPSRR